MTSDQAIQVQALAGDIVLCSQGRHFTLTVPLSTHVYKWVPANLLLGIILRWTSIPSKGEQKYSYLCHAMKSRDKPERQLGLYTDFFLTMFRYRALMDTSLQPKQATLSK